MADSISHYAARVEQNERFSVCIAPPEMREAAWKYCHHQQLIVDGTFGVCTSRLLVWIAMGVDESNRGIPVAMFLFSAPSGTRATHAGYDTKILTELLTHWRVWMGEREALWEGLTPVCRTHATTLRPPTASYQRLTNAIFVQHRA